MTEIDEKGLKLAEKHWIYIESLLNVHGEEKVVIEKIGFHYKQAMKHGYKHGVQDNGTDVSNTANPETLEDLLTFPSEVSDKPDTKMFLNPNLKGRKHRGQISLSKDEEPLRNYGTIKIYRSIYDYIWSNLPVDFKYKDVEFLVKRFYKEQLKRKLKPSSSRTFGSRYIRYFKEQDPPVISWDLHSFSKDINKYESETRENSEPLKKPGKVEEVKNIQKPKKQKKVKKKVTWKLWEPWEIQILRKQAPSFSAKYIHKHILPHRTEKAIKRKIEKLEICRITDSEQARRKLLDSGKKEDSDVHERVHEDECIDEHVDVHEHKHERVHEPESKKPFVSDKTKELLAAEAIEMEQKIAAKNKIEAEKIAADKEIEVKLIEEKKKPIIKNPFYEGTAEHHLYKMVVETKWVDVKKGTPKLLINKVMGNYPKEQIEEAIDTLVKHKKAQRLPNNFIAFSK